MLSATSATALTALWAAITAVELFSTLDQSSTAGTTGSTTSAQAPPLHSAVKVFLPLAATVALITAVACIYRHLHRAAAGGNRRLPELITFTLCASAGILVFSFFVQTGDGADDGAQARALGMAAIGALPAAAVVTFFLGMALVFPAHVRVGGEGGGGAVAGDGSVQAPMWLLTKMALVAAAALVGLMAMALYSI